MLQFGHVCDLQQADPVWPYSKLKQWISIDMKSRKTYNYFRSHKKILNERIKHQQHPHTIHPFSKLRKYWELFMCFIIYVQCVLVPFKALVKIASQNYETLESVTSYGCLTLDSISLMHIIVNFFTGYIVEKDRTAELSPAKIAKHYLTTSFFLDLYCSIPSSFVLVRHSRVDFKPRLIFFIRMIENMKLLRYPTCIAYSINVFEQGRISYYVIRLVMIFLSNIVYINLISSLCLCWIFYDLDLYAGIGEIFRKDVLISSYADQIHDSYMLLLSTTGNVAPISKSCHLFVVNVWLISKLLYILIIVYFVQMATIYNSSSSKYLDMISEVSDYLQHRRVPNFLEKRILAYYDLKFRNCYFQETEILETISAQLRQELLMHTCRHLIEKVKFFTAIPKPLAIRLVKCLHHDIYLTNDVIVKSGSFGECMYFLYNGTVAVYTQTGKEVVHLKDGDYFGEICLINPDTRRVATVVAAEICELYRLERRDFYKVVGPYPDVYNKIATAAGLRKDMIGSEDEKHRDRDGVYQLS